MKMGKIDTFIQVNILRPIRMRAIIKILNSLPINYGEILDIGCMDDYILRHNLDGKFVYQGVDSNPLPKICYTSNIKKMSVEELQNIDQKFDIVVCTEVLEHVDNPVETMNLISRVAKKYIVISVPNEPFFSLFRFFIPAREHLWTIFPWTLRKYFGKPILEKNVCFKRSHIGLWEKNQKESSV